MASNLLYLHEHLSCRHYVSDYRCSFVYRDIKAGEKMDFDNSYNYLIFLLEGKMVVSCNEFIDRSFVKDDILFIPKSVETRCTVVADSKLMVCVVDTIKNICDKFSLMSYWPLCKEIKYDFQPIKIVPQLEVFLGQLAHHLDDGIKCEHFHELKHQELFLHFRWYYTKEQLAELFHPIIGQSLSFRMFVLDNFLKVESVHELVELSAMSRSSFDVMFKKEFDMPAGQWLLKQKAKHIKFEMSKPGTNISDIIIKFNFNSNTHFNRFCRQQFGCTPQEMINKLQSY